MKDFKSIKVTKGVKTLEIDNPTNYPLIGMGAQGAVFKLSEDKFVKIYTDPLQVRMEAEALRFVKIYGKPEHAAQENKVLLSSQKLSFIPKVDETGSNYVLMENLLGPDLNTFLKKHPALSEDITRRLLDILTTMKKSGFKQIDAPVRHIILTNTGFKMVDHVYSFSRVQERPLELFQNLHERNFLNSFLEQVKTIDPKTHAEWTKTPIPLTNAEAEANGGSNRKKESRKRTSNRKREHNRKKGSHRKHEHHHKKGHDRKK